MADGHLIADDERVGAVGNVQHAEVLHVGPVANPDIMHIPANHGMEPDAALFAQYDIPDDNPGLFDKTGGWDSGFDALKSTDHRPTVGESSPDLQEAVD